MSVSRAGRVHPGTGQQALKTLSLARAYRDVTKGIARAFMNAYRQAVPAKCPNEPALLATLPDLSNKPGHTPDPVSASAVFLPPDKAKTVYEASADPDLDRYEQRGHPGEVYDENDAVVLGSNEPDDPREFITGVGLTQPGASLVTKVFVKLKTGNEAGSAAMVEKRPED